MIISHRHKFIFFKPRKVAGSSLEIALASSAGPADIVTSTVLGTDIDEDTYELRAQNSYGFQEHAPPKQVKNKIGKDTWENYMKIVVTRNPWDLVVSRWNWELYKHENSWGVLQKQPSIYEWIANKGGVNWYTAERMVQNGIGLLNTRKSVRDGDFDGFVDRFPAFWTNDFFYQQLEHDNSRHIRFEHLQEDYESLCSDLGIPSMVLPRAKTKTRSDKRHYSTYFENQKTREIVAERFTKQIERFGYTFSSGA